MSENPFGNPFYEDHVYSILDLQVWLDDNWEKYKHISNVWDCWICPTHKGLPCICDQPEDYYKWIKLYESVDDILRYYRKEKHLKNVMNEYDQVQFSEVDLKIWLYKNESLGTKDYCNFLSDYLEYNSQDTEHNNLRVGPGSDNTRMTLDIVSRQLGVRQGRQLAREGVNSLDRYYMVYIDRSEFTYGIRFAQVFDELFFLEQLLPDRLALFYENIG